MARHSTIRCGDARCGSYRVERRPDPVRKRFWLMRLLDWSPAPLIPNDDPKPGTYDCRACGAVFEVRDVEAYAREHPWTPDRCLQCDAVRLELVERDVNPYGDPQSPARADVHRCAACGARFLFETASDPGMLDG